MTQGEKAEGTRAAGSPAFTAPELCGQETVEVDGKAADVWALGITFWMLLFGEAPFRAEGLIGLLRLP